MPDKTKGQQIVESFLDGLHEVYITHNHQRCMIIPESKVPDLAARFDAELSKGLKQIGWWGAPDPVFKPRFFSIKPETGDFDPVYIKEPENA